VPKDSLSRLKSQLALLFASRETRRHARAGSPQLWRMQREFQFDFLKRMGLERTQVLLDLGCGTLCGGLPLIEFLERGHYFGVDVRADVLDEARAELREAGLEHKAPVLLHATDLGSLELGRSVDWIWAFSVLLHMEDSVLERAFELVGRHLAQDGCFYANVRTEGGAAGERWQEFPVVTRALEPYREIGARHGLVLRDLGSLSGLGHATGDPAQDGQRMLLWRRGAR